MIPASAEAFHMSPQQRELWARTAEGEGRNQLLLRLKGDLDVDCLRRAVHRLVERHEMLRTVLRRRPGMKWPLQVVLDELEPGWVEEDARDLDGKEPHQYLERLLSLDTTLDPVEGPVLEAHLLRIDAGTFALRLATTTFHGDGFSMARLGEELLGAYAGRLEDDEDVLQYVQFSEWQIETLEELAQEVGGGGEDPLGDLAEGVETPIPELPLELADSADSDGKPRTAGVVGLGVTGDLARRLAVAEEREDLLLAAWRTFLQRLHGGTLRLELELDGRKFEEFESALGPFARRLPVVWEPLMDLRFTEVQERCRRRRLAALEVQELVTPAEEEPTASGVAFRHLPGPDFPPVPGLTVSTLGLRSDGIPAKLMLSVVDGPEGLVLELVYDVVVFSRQTIERWGAGFLALLEAVLARDPRTARRLPFLGEDEAEHLRLLGCVEPAPKVENSVPERLAALAAEHPSAIALACGGQTVTFGEMLRRADGLAAELRRRGVRRESRVGLLVERSEEALIHILAIWRAGGAYLPLEAGLPAARLAELVADAGVELVVCDEALADHLGEGVPTVAAATAEHPANRDFMAPRIFGEQLAYVLFTSGSTGKPKGVMVEHRQLAGYTAAVTERLAGSGEELAEVGDWATVTTFAADLGHTAIFPALCAGRTVHVFESETLSNPVAFAAAMEAGDIGGLKIVPSHLGALLSGEDAGRSLPRCLLVLGGEACDGELVARCRKLVPGLRIFNHYGPTETTVGVTAGEVEAGDDAGVGAVPLGSPLRGDRLLLLDPRGEPTPLGGVGEICVGGMGVSRGYIGRPASTAERFVPDPSGMEIGARVYHTGDLASYRLDGALQFVGRADHQLKVRGFRVELGEIEAVLERQETVRRAVVVAPQDERGVVRLVAWVVPRPGPRPRAEELLEALGQTLPDYMVPPRLGFLDRLPLNANGKVDRAALPSPEEISRAERRHTPPRTDLEKTLGVLWGEVLGVEEIGVHDSFFALGGDSILAIQLIGRAGREGLSFSPQDLFDARTIAELAPRVVRGVARAAEQGKVLGELPLTPIQRWFFEPGRVSYDHFNQSVLLATPAALETSLLKTVLAALAAHHDMLRCRFIRDGSGVWKARIGAEAEMVVEAVDLSAAHEDERPYDLAERCAAAQAGLSLAEGPLLRAVTFDLGAAGGRLLLACHHAVVDGVSWRILLADLETAWQQALSGSEIVLPPKTTSFKLWAERLVRAVADGCWEAEREYWLALPEVGEAPSYRQDEGKNTLASSRRANASLDEDETRTLLQDVPEVYRTRIEDALLTALVTGWHRWCGRPELLVDLEGHGREDLFEDLDLSRTVGWFTTHYPVSLSLRPGEGVGQTFRRVKETLRAVPGAGIGYGLLRYLDEGELGTALHQRQDPRVSFNYLGQFDNVLDQESQLALASETPGPERPPEEGRSHELEFSLSVMGGKLHVSITHSENLYETAAVSDLAQGFIEALRTLIEHCRSPEAGGYTPSDFPLAKLDSGTLDRISEQLADEFAHSRKNIEDLYPLSPLQESLLQHCLAAATSDVGFEQSAAVLGGPLDIGAFERSWQRLVERHPILRTAFLVEGVEQPLQVVRRQVPFRVENSDWRKLSPEQRTERLEETLRADREKGFDLRRAPLMRVRLVRLDDERHQLIWSYHHLLLDGWCRGLVMQELFAFYDAFQAGLEPDVPRGRPFQDYIAWLKAQDGEAAEGFWCRHMADLEGPTPLGIDQQRPRDEPAPDAFVDRQLGPEEAEELTVFARGAELTLNTLVQGAWGLLLARYGGTEDVVFGTTVSGRPTDLPGSDAMLGMFINNLPVRLRVDEERVLLPWLGEVQETLLGLRSFESSTADRIRSAADLSFSQRLFESLVLFQNYPVGEVGQELATRNLRVEAFRFRLETAYPLTLLVGPGDGYLLRLHYDGARFERGLVEQWMDHLLGILRAMPGGAERPLAELPWVEAGEAESLAAAWSNNDLADRLGARALALLDRHGRPVPRGVPGEIHLDGGAKRPAGVGLRARLLADDHLEFLGDLEAPRWQRGVRVDVGEVEALLRRHPAVAEVAVLWRPDGEGGEPVLCAFVAAEGDSSPGASELRRHLRRFLPAAALPRHFVRLAEGASWDPLGSDRTALHTAPLEPLEEAVTAAVGTLEGDLAEIWADVLDLEMVAPKDDFFDLGGHSLLAQRLVSRVRKVFGVEISHRLLFEQPTVAAMAHHLERARRAGVELPDIEPVPRDGSPLPLSSAQERLWFMHQMEPESTAYNSPRALWVEGPLVISALAAAFDALVGRHEALRARFPRDEKDRPWQVLEPTLRCPLAVADLRALPAEQREAVAHRAVARLASRPFDLSQGPLFRAALLTVEAERSIVLLELHHIVSDGWSMDVVIREVKAFYEAAVGGHRPSLPRLEVQYADYAAWQNRFLEGEAVEHHLSYWRRQLAGLPEEPLLRGDHRRPEERSLAGQDLYFQLSADLLSGLRNLGRESGATLFMTLLAAFQTLLHRVTGATDIAVGTDVAGRDRLELEALVGFFVNNLVLRADFEGNPSFSRLLAQVRETTLDAYAHQELPFDLLVKALGVQRRNDRTPLFQVLFVLQNTPRSAVQVSDLTLRPLDEAEGEGGSKFDLALFLAESPDGLLGKWTFATDLFDSATIADLSRRYQRLLEDLLARGDAPISRYDLGDATAPRKSGARLAALRKKRRATASSTT